MKHRIHHFSHKTAVYLQAVVLVLPIVLGVVPVFAADLSVRSIRLSTSRPGASAEHTFTFTVPNTANIGSISFTYCTNSPLPNVPCVAPSGHNVATAQLASQAGNTGFTLNGAETTANKLVISRPSVAGSAVVSSYRFDTFLNPPTAGETVYVRIALYTTTDATGLADNVGAVAFATADAFNVQAYVPPFLIFCVGVFVTLNCNSASGFRVDVGELSANNTSVASMQFSGATNDPTGYTTYLSGFTMTSGNNIVNPLANNSGSVPGTSQFGLNLRANNAPSGGLDPTGNGASVAQPGYGTPNSFRFVNGEALTNSPTSTDFKIFTATYIINVPKSQPPGIYATTMTYTAVASF